MLVCIDSIFFRDPRTVRYVMGLVPSSKLADENLEGGKSAGLDFQRVRDRDSAS